MSLDLEPSPMHQWPLDTPLRRFAAALISGAMISIAEGLHPWWPIAWIAPIPLLCAAFEARRFEASCLAALAAVVGCAGVISYYLEVAGLVVTILVPIGRALSFAIVVSIARMAVVRWRHWLSIFVYPCLMSAADLLTTIVSRHGSAGSLAYSQMGATWIVQVAALAGTPGVVFVMSLLPSTAAVAWYHRDRPRRFRVGYAMAGMIIAAALAYGMERIRSCSPQRTLKIALVAIDTPGVVDGSSPQAPTIWKTYSRAIEEAAGKGARVVVMPEKVATLNSTEASSLKGRLSRVAEDNRVYLVVGVTIETQGHLENRAWMFSPTGRLEADYSKQHLVPGFEDSFEPGRNIAVRIVDGVMCGLAICKDMDFPSLGRSYGAQDVRLMLVPAWDFRRDGWLHSRMAVLRGVEGGFAVARAARDGLLTISDCCGRVVHERSSSALPYASLVGAAPIILGRGTVYSRLGDALGWIISLAGVLISIKAAITVSLWNWLRAGSR